MPQTLHLAAALLPDGVAENVRLTVENGTIARVESGVARSGGDEAIAGLVLPGLPNLHSHLFQRGMAGLAERRGESDDSFWTWREVMYRFLDRLNPDDVRAIAAQAMVEMLEGGFTALAEFHYLHHDPDGRPYADIAAMGAAIAEAAGETGIGLTLLPVLYRYGNFGAAAPVHGQRRFLNGRDGYQRLLQASERAVAGLPDARVGVAPHSLRAVALDDLGWVASLRPRAPVHIHVAEQTREVDDAIAATGRRSVELLMDSVAVDPRWCLIHATHLTDAERDAMAASGAVAGLCPITEANLGDGIFDGVRYRAAGGRIGVGTDSNVEIGAAGELRLLEYSQRLRDRRRALWAQPGQSVGTSLWREACAGGAQACGRDLGRIEAGCRADLVALDLDHPALVAKAGEVVLDSALFAAPALPVAEVRVGGKAVVAAGRHIDRERIRARYGETIRRVLG